MTAEVALLNSTAVALAADSAMTLGSSGKVYPANKLYALSKYHPVGVMIYNNAELMGVPWETIIKMYRRSIGHSTKKSCKEYLVDLLHYVTKSPICNDDQRVANLLRTASNLYRYILGNVNEELRNIFQKKRSISSRDEKEAIRLAVVRHLDKLEGLEESPSMNLVDVDGLISSHQGDVDECINLSFSGLQITNEIRRSLHRILALSINIRCSLSGYSGIVVAGFGPDEMFPSLVEARTDGILGSSLKYEIIQEVDIGRSGTFASIIPFAQREMVDRFMEGVDPDFLLYSGKYLESLLYRFGKELLENANFYDEKQLKTIRNSSTKYVEDYFDSAGDFVKKNFVDPIMDIVVHLPKDELANMAEALVNLTSLKRRVSHEPETVSGPVDIAIISKGDGFVWIKRKHYFERHLNPSYFFRYSSAEFEENFNEPKPEQSDCN